MNNNIIAVLMLSMPLSSFILGWFIYEGLKRQPRPKVEVIIEAQKVEGLKVEKADRVESTGVMVKDRATLSLEAGSTLATSSVGFKKVEDVTDVTLNH